MTAGVVRPEPPNDRDTKPTGRSKPRTGDPSPTQVRNAIRTARANGVTLSYRQAWTLVRDVQAQDRELLFGSRVDERLDALYSLAGRREAERLGLTLPPVEDTVDTEVAMRLFWDYFIALVKDMKSPPS